MNRVLKRLQAEVEALELQIVEGMEEDTLSSLLGKIEGLKIAIEFIHHRQTQRRKEKLDENEGPK